MARARARAPQLRLESYQGAIRPESASCSGSLPQSSHNGRGFTFNNSREMRMTSTPNTHRRMLLQAAAGLAAASQHGAVGAGQGAPAAASGKAGDFDFLAGEWKISHRQLKDKRWDAFEGEASVTSLLGGLASVEELRIPSRNFSGMGLRMLDVKQGRWADYWCNSKTGVLNPATWGGFRDGVGIWDADDAEDGKAVIVRGTWDQIGPASCRWHQAVSRDGGRTWAQNWVMDWRRAG
jgi:hypothetical protein